MLFCGIDPGKHGAWAIINEDCEVFAFGDDIVSFKTDGASQILTSTLLEESTLPMIFSMKTKTFIPRKGAQEYKRDVGKWEGILEILEISHSLVKPQKWQKEILGNIPKGKSKEYAYTYARKKWPTLNLLKKHDGLIDALCIAEYARRVHLQNADNYKKLTI